MDGGAKRVFFFIKSRKQKTNILYKYYKCLLNYFLPNLYSYGLERANKTENTITIIYFV